ncbi:Heptaprenyl diphosphate synthase component 2 [Pseudoclavibacter triregionum]|nr:Heptaprenyl diphosphate synthase component 2 [Pseudoclavibacter triregionum]
MKPTAPEARRTPATSMSGTPYFTGDGSAELQAQVEAGLERVEALLHDEVVYADEIARVTATYLMDAGGKRLRPMLALLTSRFGPDADSDDVIRAGAAVEITHLASLYHDDVMDEADLRRGVLAAHLNWSNSVAILAGDLLFARSSLMFAALGQRAIELQATTFERLVLGQMRETVGPKAGEDRIAHYIEVLADKTGSLIAASAQFGAICAKAPEELIPALAEYGEKVGVAFQIADDVIDLSPQSEATGKLAGTDLRAGVETLPVLLLEREAGAGDAEAGALLERIRTRVAGSAKPRQLGAPAPGTVAGGVEAAPEQTPAADGATEATGAASAAEVDAIVEELRSHAVTGETLAEARRWADEAVAALAPLPEGPAKDALIAFARSVVERDR